MTININDPTVFILENISFLVENPLKRTMILWRLISENQQWVTITTSGGYFVLSSESQNNSLKICVKVKFYNNLILEDLKTHKVYNSHGWNFYVQYFLRINICIDARLSSDFRFELSIVLFHTDGKWFF